MNLFIDTDPPIRLLAAFQQQHPELTPDWIVQPPGREMWVAAAVVAGGQFAVTASDLDSRVVFSYQSAKLKKTITNRPLAHWARYPAGVMLMLSNGGMDIPGLVAVIAGEEPAGPRYEYALGITFAALWHRLHGQDCTAAELIEIVDRARREYIET